MSCRICMFTCWPDKASDEGWSDDENIVAALWPDLSWPSSKAKMVKGPSPWWRGGIDVDRLQFAEQPLVKILPKDPKAKKTRTPPKAKSKGKGKAVPAVKVESSSSSSSEEESVKEVETPSSKDKLQQDGAGSNQKQQPDVQEDSLDGEGDIEEETGEEGQSGELLDAARVADKINQDTNQTGGDDDGDVGAKLEEQAAGQSGEGLARDGQGGLESNESYVIRALGTVVAWLGEEIQATTASMEDIAAQIRLADEDLTEESRADIAQALQAEITRLTALELEVKIKLGGYLKLRRWASDHFQTFKKGAMADEEVEAWIKTLSELHPTALKSPQAVQRASQALASLEQGLPRSRDTSHSPSPSQGAKLVIGPHPMSSNASPGPKRVRSLSPEDPNPIVPKKQKVSQSRLALHANLTWTSQADDVTRENQAVVSLMALGTSGR